MSFNFNPDDIDPATGTPLDAIRWLIADTISPGEVSDEAITAIYNGLNTSLTQTQRVYDAAVKAATYMYRLYSRQASFSSGGTSVQYTERAKQWYSILTDLQLAASSVQNGPQYFIYSRRRASYCEE